MCKAVLQYLQPMPIDLLKSMISNLVHNAFRKKDGSVRYTHIKVTRAQGYFTHDINGVATTCILQITFAK